MRIMRKSATIGATAAATVTMGAAAAFAGTPYPITVWSSPSGTHVLSASSGTWGINVTHGTPPNTVTMGCTSSTTSGTTNYVTAGVNVDPAMTFNSLSLAGCTMPGSSAVYTPLGTWTFEADSGATSGSDVVRGRLTNISVKATASPIPALCTFQFGGYADATYDEANGRLTVDPTGMMFVTTVSGCGGTLAPWDPVTLSATYQMNTVDGLAFAANAINIG